jgi:cold shock protein
MFRYCPATVMRESWFVHRGADQVLRRVLLVEVQHDYIVVRVTGTSYTASYYKPEDSSQLIARYVPAKNDHRAPMTRADFLAQAWGRVNWDGLCKGHASFPKFKAPSGAQRHTARLSETLRERTIPMRLNGTVKFFNSTRGFGFIAPDTGEKDVFVHSSALAHSDVSLKEGDKVSFEVEDDTRGRGKQAAKVELS